jgi:hypothetical protein
MTKEGRTIRLDIFGGYRRTSITEITRIRTQGTLEQISEIIRGS